jgi:hypothetical protein
MIISTNINFKIPPKSALKRIIKLTMNSVKVIWNWISNHESLALRKYEMKIII